MSLPAALKGFLIHLSLYVSFVKYSQIYSVRGVRYFWKQHFTSNEKVFIGLGKEIIQACQVYPHLLAQPHKVSSFKSGLPSSVLHVSECPCKSKLNWLYQVKISDK